MPTISASAVEGMLGEFEQEGLSRSETDIAFLCSGSDPSGGGRGVLRGEPTVPVLNSVGPDGRCVSRELADLLMQLVNGRLSKYFICVDCCHSSTGRLLSRLFFF